MLETYKATLQGNKIEWQGETPRDLPVTVSVFVTILDNEPAQRKNNGKKMAQALAKVAALEKGTIAELENPSEWQREQRRDRQLAERED